MKRHAHRIARGLALAASLAATLVTTGAAAEPTRGKTEGGIAYAMGGVTISDLQDLERHRDRFSLWITTAAKKTGAYLADVQVRITRADGNLVFNAPIPGPWLFIDLPPGRYRIEAAHRGRPQTRSTQIHAGDRHQLLFYFDDPADVSPEWEKPFKDNPYGK
jgi:hypothetical protein